MSITRSYLLSAAVLCIGMSTARAQYPLSNVPQPSPPSNTNYLNLLSGRSIALNYYGIVRPQLDTYNYLNQLRTQVAANAQATVQAENTQEVSTGLRPQFQNYGRYFMNVSTGLAPNRSSTSYGLGAGAVGLSPYSRPTPR